MPAYCSTPETLTPPSCNFHDILILFSFDFALHQLLRFYFQLSFSTLRRSVSVKRLNTEVADISTENQLQQIRLHCHDNLVFQALRPDAFYPNIGSV